MALPITSPAFSDALVILGATGLVIPTFARFRVNPVIGFILVGVLVGPAGLGSLTADAPWLYYLTITHPRSIDAFAELGIILLLFSIGLELSFKRLWSMRAQVFGFGATELLGSGLIIALALMALGQYWTGAIGLGLALSLSSTALVLPIVGTTGPIGRLAFAMLLFEDLALVPIIFGLGAIAPAGGAGVDSLVNTLLLGTGAIIAMLIAGRFLLPVLFAQAARTKSPEVFLAVSLLAVIVASTVTTVTGLSPIVGALLAGILIAETDYHTEVEATTAPLKGLALGVFLITIGMSINLREVADYWLELTMAVVGVVAAKSVVTAALLRLSGVGRGVAVETSTLMASPSETTLIVLGVALQGGLIASQTAAFWQTVTAIGLTITPLLARIGSSIARRIEVASREDDTLRDIAVGPGTVIVGFGRVGRLVADMLRTHDKKFIAVEADIDAVVSARREGYPVIFGDVGRPGMLDRLDLGQRNALVLTMDQPALAVRLVRKVRVLHPHLPIIARARDTTNAAELYRAGVTSAAPEALEASLQLSEAVLVELGVAMGPVIASIHDKRHNLHRQVRDAANLDFEPRVTGRRLRDLDI